MNVTSLRSPRAHYGVFAMYGRDIGINGSVPAVCDGLIQQSRDVDLPGCSWVSESYRRLGKDPRVRLHGANFLRMRDITVLTGVHRPRLPPEFEKMSGSLRRDLARGLVQIRLGVDVVAVPSADELTRRETTSEFQVNTSAQVSRLATAQHVSEVSVESRRALTRKTWFRTKCRSLERRKDPGR